MASNKRPPDHAEYTRFDNTSHPDPDKYYAQYKVRPGRHDIRWARTFHISFMIEPDRRATFENRARIRLKKGHVYGLHAERTFGPYYSVSLFIRDETTEEVVASGGAQRVD